MGCSVTISNILSGVIASRITHHGIVKNSVSLAVIKHRAILTCRLLLWQGGWGSSLRRRKAGAICGSSYMFVFILKMGKKPMGTRMARQRSLQ